MSWSREQTKNLSGKAKVEFNSQRQIRVTMLENGEQYYIKSVPNLSKCPRWLKSGIWWVQWDNQNSHIQRATPIEADVEGVFAGIAHKENEPPTPRLKKGKYGDYTVFNLLLEVDTGDYKGMILSPELPCNFEPFPTPQGLFVKFSHPKSSFTDMLDSCLTALCITEKASGENWDMAWPEDGNVLPILEQRGMKARIEWGVRVKITIASGFVSTIRRIGKDVVPEVSEWDEEPEQKPDSTPDPDFEASNQPPVEHLTSDEYKSLTSGDDFDDLTNEQEKMVVKYKEEHPDARTLEHGGPDDPDEIIWQTQHGE